MGIFAPMLETYVRQRFARSADALGQCAAPLASPIAAAAEALLECVTSGGKVLACGNGASGALAHYTAALLVGGLERERPALPALALGASAVRGGWADVFAAQVRALGQAGDALLLLSAGASAQANLVQAAQQAHEREMCVIALTAAGGGALAQALLEGDVLIEAPPGGVAAVHEAHLLALHAMCAALDQLLLGEEPLGEESSTASL